MALELVLTLEGDKTFKAKLAPADLMHFERHFKVGFEEAAKALSTEHVLYLAYRSARRTKATDLEFDEWADTVSEFGEPMEVPLETSGAVSAPLPPLPESHPEN